jgi:hypothetical protein
MSRNCQILGIPNAELADELFPQAPVAEFGLEAQEPPLGQTISVDLGHPDAAPRHRAETQPAQFRALKSPTVGNFFFAAHCFCKINANNG